MDFGFMVGLVEYGWFEMVLFLRMKATAGMWLRARRSLGAPASSKRISSAEQGILFRALKKVQPDAAGHELAILEIRFQQRRIPVFDLQFLTKLIAPGKEDPDFAGPTFANWYSAPMAARQLL